MTDRDFTYWLQGFAELNEAPPSKAQWKSIREHLALVFEKRTPDLRQLVPQLGRIVTLQQGPLRSECSQAKNEYIC